MQGAWFFFIDAVNSDSDTHPNVFLGIISLQNSCSNDSNGSDDRTSIDSSTNNKMGVVIFKGFAVDRDFGTYHKLLPVVKLP